MPPALWMCVSGGEGAGATRSAFGGLWYDERCRLRPARSSIAGLSSFDELVRGQRKQAELRALLKRSQRVYTRTTTTHSLPNLG
jgi:hypothetical protein